MRLGEETTLVLGRGFWRGKDDGPEAASEDVLLSATFPRLIVPLGFVFLFFFAGLVFRCRGAGILLEEGGTSAGAMSSSQENEALASGVPASSGTVRVTAFEGSLKETRWHD